jgi:hypothetical protein
VVTGFREEAGRLEALRIAEDLDGELCEAGEVLFGLRGMRECQSARKVDP